MKLFTATLIFCFLFGTLLTAQQYDLYYYSYDTDLVQPNEPRMAELAVTVPIQYNFAVQAAYSPLKHVILSSGFNYRPNYRRDLDETFGQRSFNFAIGTYLNFTENLENLPSYEQRAANSLLLALHVGYGRHEYNTDSGSEINTSYATEIGFESVFVNGSLGYEYKFGKIFTTLSYRRIFINKAIFSGSNYESDRLAAMLEQLREETEYDIFSLGFHNRFGKKAVRFLTGVNIPFYFFQNFKGSAATVADSGNLYLGIVLDIGSSIDYINNKPKKGD